MSADSTAELDALLRNSVHIEPLALEEEFVRLPADLAFFNAQHAEAYQRALISKLDREVVEARLYKEGAEYLEDVGETGRGGKPTEAAIKSWVVQNKTYQEAKRSEIAADADERRLRGVVSAIQAKKDCIVSIGAHHRAELNGPYVSKQGRNEPITDEWEEAGKTT